MQQPTSAGVTRAQINEYLARRGLGQLGDPGLVAQIGYLVRDDAHFRSLLMACEPLLRSAMYEALAPNLRFKPRPLDVYIAEARMDAEARQLPIIAPDGKLEQYYPPEARSIDSAPPRDETKIWNEETNIWNICRYCGQPWNAPGHMTGHGEGCPRAREDYEASHAVDPEASSPAPVEEIAAERDAENEDAG